VREFNKNVRTSAFTTSLVRGRRINRDEYLLGHRNRIAELAPFSPNLIAGCITNPNTVLKVIGTYKQNDLFFGCHGSFVLNVPRGRYAKIWLGQTPKLLDQGPHVIHDPNLRFDVASGFVQMVLEPPNIVNFILFTFLINALGYHRAASKFPTEQ